MSNSISNELKALTYDRTLEELRFNKKCNACGLATGKAVCSSIGNQDLTKMKLVVVSDYPGHYEETFSYCMYSNEDRRKGKRGSNKGWPNAGNYIRDYITREFGLDTYEEVYFTNAVKCNPRKDKPDISRHIKKCYSLWLSNEFILIDRVNPTVPVLVLGDTAFKCFGKVIKNGPFTSLGKSPKMKDARRKIFYYNSHPLAVTVNPAAVASSSYRLERSEVSSTTSMVYYWELPPLVGSPQWHYNKDLEVIKPYVVKQTVDP